jgi:hypothetical protein
MSYATCARHKGLCAWTGDTAIECPWCHCTWNRITGPATELHQSRSWSRPKDGSEPQPIVTTETRWLFGRGELALEHIRAHLAGERRSEKEAQKRDLAKVTS